MELLLIQPPATKPAEPPLGVAVLLRHLRRRRLAVEAIDANLAAYLFLLAPERLAAAAGPQPGTALKRALKKVPAALELLRSPAATASFARYADAVRHLNLALEVYRGAEGSERLTLGDYGHQALSPFRPADLEALATGRARTLFHAYFTAELVPAVLALQPRRIGLSVNFLHQVLPAFELAGLLRRRLPGVELIGGGGVFSSWQPLLGAGGRLPPFDRLHFGPGEGLAIGGAADPLPAAAPEFEPDFSFAPLGRYLSPRPVLPVSASRGCYWARCRFCPEATAPTHPYHGLAPAAVPRLLLELQRRYGVDHFHFTDNAIPVPVLNALAGRDELAGLHWHGFVRFEAALADPGLAAGLARAGCRLLHLGLESASPAVLARLAKGGGPELAARVLANLRRAGIASYVYLLFGTPGETAADGARTLAFVEEHRDEIGFLNLAVMNLPRDSSWCEAPEAAGILSSAPRGEDEPLGLYRSFAAASGWDRRDARRFLRQEFQSSPAVRAILRRTPPLFTSNHALFFPPG